MTYSHYLHRQWSLQVPNYLWNIIVYALRRPTFLNPSLCPIRSQFEIADGPLKILTGDD